MKKYGLKIEKYVWKYGLKNGKIWTQIWTKSQNMDGIWIKIFEFCTYKRYFIEKFIKKQLFFIKDNQS